MTKYLFQEGETVKYRIVRGDYWIHTSYGEFKGYTKTGRVRIKRFTDQKTASYAPHNVTFERSNDWLPRVRKPRNEVDYMETVQGIGPDNYTLNAQDRFDAGFKRSAKDCVCAAITTATGRNYIDVYNDLLDYSKPKRRYGNRRGCHPAHGMYRNTYMGYIEYYCDYKRIKNLSRDDVTLKQFAEENPTGSFMVVLRTHALALVDGVYYDRLTRTAKYWKKKHYIEEIVQFR